MVASIKAICHHIGVFHRLLQYSLERSFALVTIEIIRNNVLNHLQLYIIDFILIIKI